MPDGRKLVGASFRGAPFFVEVSDRTGGRRTVVHEFPQRDDPYVEDLGRLPRTFRLEGYVVGPDYLAQRDALLAALEDEAGPGELVHPYYGTVRAVCTSLVTRETRADGGHAVFQLDFQVVPAVAPAPVDAPDLPAQVAGAADAAGLAVTTELEQSYEVDGQPSFALQSLADEYSAFVDGLEAELAPLAEATQEAAALQADILILRSATTSLVKKPGDMTGSLLAVLEDLADTIVETPRAVALALAEVYADLGAVPAALGITATRVLERANQLALVAGLRRMLAIEAARLLPLVRYETLDDATADAAAIAALLDDQAAAATSSYPDLVELRAQLRRAVPGDQVLARLITVERPVAVPSILLAYQLYGSTAREGDLVARNRVRHPGFVVGTLQAISDG
jgi:prophage DNA circulation protein